MRSFQSIFGRKEMNDNEPQSREHTGIIKLIHGEELVVTNYRILIHVMISLLWILHFYLGQQLSILLNGEMFKVDLVPWLKFAKDEVAFIERSKVISSNRTMIEFVNSITLHLERYYLG